MFDGKSMMKRIIEARTLILNQYPFYGDLLLQLQPAIASCGTACTDMDRIIFDPGFMENLSDNELVFIMLHEVMHCVLNHCIRLKKHEDTYRYNMAADIVVNSIVMNEMAVDHFDVYGTPVIHLTPDGREGFNFTAEEVYQMLESFDETAGMNTIDNHELWQDVDAPQLKKDRWLERMHHAAKHYGALDSLPASFRNLTMLNKSGKIDWRSVLRNFILENCVSNDYDFSPPDNRFAGYDFVLPAFNEIEEEGYTQKDIWFCVDTSGSISDEMLAEFFNEVRSFFCHLSNLRGLLSFFSTMVTTPIRLDCYTEDIRPLSTGGTSFHCIFDYLKEKMIDHLPAAVIILTDGFAEYPELKMTLNIPVLWILSNYLCEKPPFGKMVLICE